MKKTCFLVLFYFLPFILKGQGIDNLWLMGHECCSTYFHPMNLNFSSGSLNIDTVHRTMNFWETNGVICDRNGTLLFYTNGIYIANAQDDTMQNGDNLNPGPFTTSKAFSGLPLPQGNLIIPFPDDSTKYYLFHETSDDPNVTWSTFYLYYSIIDMTLDSGLGAVVQKNTVLLNDTLVEGRLTACRHANGRDWWLVAPEYLTGEKFKFLITPQGILGPFKQDLQSIRENWFGQAIFSEQGDKFAYYEPVGDLDIFDFDRCTGDFSFRIHIDINDNAGVGGLAFSPSGQYLYVSSVNYVYQFDIWATNIEQSRITIAEWDSTYFLGPPFAANFYLSALAPDNKIYINCGNSTNILHVINFPDSAGVSCDFCQHCIQLPAINSFTIPNHPNYFLGTKTGSICDSLNIGISDITRPIQSFNLFPNPARGVLYITQQNNDLIKAINIFNSIGQKQSVFYSSIKYGEYIEMNISTLASGIFFMEMITDKQKIVKRFIKQ
jgi:DNA-binding beta-propeller fold protein YncE